MKRVMLAAGMGGLVLAVGAISGLGTIGLVAGTALAGGFGWMLGGLPSGPSEPGPHTGNGDGGGSGGGNDGGGDGGNG
jgi:hypothetical protein